MWRIRPIWVAGTVGLYKNAHDVWQHLKSTYWGGSASHAGYYGSKVVFPLIHDGADEFDVVLMGSGFGGWDG